MSDNAAGFVERAKAASTARMRAAYETAYGPLEESLTAPGLLFEMFWVIWGKAWPVAYDTGFEDCAQAHKDIADAVTPPASWDEYAMDAAGKLVDRHYPGGLKQMQAAIHVALIDAMSMADRAQAVALAPTSLRQGEALKTMHSDVVTAIQQGYHGDDLIARITRIMRPTEAQRTR